MTTKQIGQAAEGAAAAWLEQSHGYVILARNWRTRWNEIDIIARHPDGRICFVEVKYRRNVRYGTGLEYISYDKSVRLLRAASAWCMLNGYAGDYQLDVVSVGGNAPDYEFELVANAVSA